MAALKTFALRLVTERRLTTGQISAAVLEDEDYLEILKVGSFRPANLQEARVSATDTAAETQSARISGSAAAHRLRSCNGASIGVPRLLR
jgi:hypothetical protein